MGQTTLHPQRKGRSFSWGETLVGMMMIRAAHQDNVDKRVRIVEALSLSLGLGTPFPLPAPPCTILQPL